MAAIIDKRNAASAGPHERWMDRWRERHHRPAPAGAHRSCHSPEGDTWIALDCETTSLDPRHAELVALAAVEVVGERILVSRALDLRLQRPESLTADSIRVHGLRGVDLLAGEAMGDALRRLLDFVGDRPLIGWCLNYDLAIIDRQLRPRFGFTLPNRRLDVCREYLRHCRRAHPGLEPDLRFESVAEALGVPVIQRHSALGDAISTALMHLRLMRLQ